MATQPNLRLHRLLDDLSSSVVRLHPAPALVAFFSATTSSRVNLSPKLSSPLWKTLNHRET